MHHHLLFYQQQNSEGDDYETLSRQTWREIEAGQV